jgi:hypothetical protein
MSESLTLYVLKTSGETEDARRWKYLGRSGIMVEELKLARTFSGLGPAKVSRNTWKRRMGGHLLRIVELIVTEGKVVE